MEIRDRMMWVDAPASDSQIFLNLCRFWSEPDSGHERGLHCGLPPAVRTGDLSFKEIQTWSLQTATDL